MNDIDLHQLRCLVTLGEERNFGRAAARLYMSQPPLTRLLSEVERTIGAKLFERTTRRVELTPIGEVFLAEAREVLARADAAMENIQAAVRRQAGLVRLAYTPMALQTILPRILTEFREREHDARVDLVELSGEVQHDALAASHVDLAFSNNSIAEEGYSSVLLHREPLSLLVPEGHPLATETIISLKKMEGEPLIMHPRQDYPGYYDRVLAVFQEAGITPRIVHREAGQNCAALVIGGNGVLLTSGAHNRSYAPGLRLIGIEPAHQLHEDIWATWLEERLSSQARVLTNLLQAHSI